VKLRLQTFKLHKVKEVAAAPIVPHILNDISAARRKFVWIGTVPDAVHAGDIGDQHEEHHRVDLAAEHQDFEVNPLFSL
jgi:hypothetical protein